MSFTFGSYADFSLVSQPDWWYVTTQLVDVAIVRILGSGFSDRDLRYIQTNSAGFYGSCMNMTVLYCIVYIYINIYIYSTCIFPYISIYTYVYTVYLKFPWITYTCIMQHHAADFNPYFLVDMWDEASVDGPRDSLVTGLWNPRFNYHPRTYVDDIGVWMMIGLLTPLTSIYMYIWYILPHGNLAWQWKMTQMIEIEA